LDSRDKTVEERTGIRVKGREARKKKNGLASGLSAIIMAFLLLKFIIEGYNSAHTQLSVWGNTGLPLV